jgi:hypothetical protein
MGEVEASCGVLFVTVREGAYQDGGMADPLGMGLGTPVCGVAVVVVVVCDRPSLPSVRFVLCHTWFCLVMGRSPHASPPPSHCVCP